MKNRLLTIACVSAIALSATAVQPRWLESDSVLAVAQRTRADFPFTVEEFLEIAQKKYPDLTMEKLQLLIDKKYVETLSFDGTNRVFKKALRNMALLDPALSGFTHRGADASPQRISYVDSILQWQNGQNPVGGAHRVVYRFSVDVPNHQAIQGDLLRVWLPLPMKTQRQNHIKILSASHPIYLSDGESEHNTVHFMESVGAPGDTTHFEYTASFDTKGEYFSPDYILSHLKPYKKKSSLYKEYTAFEAPHIVRLDSLAKAIAGDETNPFLLSEKVYDYIISNYPWAGAREYSTIPCIPKYVIDQKHGDCGQVSLLYISLMRTLGIPARWESGWMLHPGEKNLHDWAEVYFEGVGWVPVDPSFGRYTSSDNPDIQNFYSHGMDSHRLAANKAIGKPFVPAKQYIRSETVDSQMGEVETLQGNLFYPAWDSHLEIISITPIEAKQ